MPRAARAEIAPGLSASTPGDPILHTTLYSAVTVQVKTTCVPTGATTDTGCSKNTDTVHVNQNIDIIISSGRDRENQEVDYYIMQTALCL